MNVEQIKKELHELNMCLACDDNLGLLTRSRMEERVERLEKLLEQQPRNPNKKSCVARNITFPAQRDSEYWRRIL